jgi:hypothetical protein
MRWRRPPAAASGWRKQYPTKGAPAQAVDGVTHLLSAAVCCNVGAQQLHLMERHKGSSTQQQLMRPSSISAEATADTAAVNRMPLLLLLHLGVTAVA